MSGCSAATYNLFVNQGATFYQTFTVESIPCCATGPVGSMLQPINLTGYSASMKIKQYAGGNVVYYDASANITLGGTSGVITIEIPSTDTSSFTWYVGVYTLFLTDTSGVTTDLLSGKVQVCTSVTAGVEPTFYILLQDGTDAILLQDGVSIIELQVAP